MRKHKPRKPSMVSSDISSHQELDTFLCQKGLGSVDCCITLDSEDTGALSSYLKSLAPEFSRKLYPPTSDESGRCICGRIDRNGVDSWACLLPRVDGNEIDIDFAIWDSNSNQLSSVYHPTFTGRTSPSADVAKELDGIYGNGVSQISSLCNIAPTIHAAFEYCKQYQ